ncbi:MAG: DUF1295 domain-containing protein [Bdellovibrionaceae bacterium]|nr:DUF1295 domain-containing protein [Pseudobdellovibrionaceae bacterium]
MNTDIWWYGFIAAMVLFQLTAIPALILKKNDLADVLWGPAFTISAAIAIYFGNPRGFSDLNLHAQIIFALVFIWSARLFYHVGLRNLSHREEDVRYNNWRKQWGSNWAWRSYLQVFVLQPLILYLFLTPVLLVISSEAQSMGFFAWIGIAVWVFGFVMESVADEQLRRFKLQPTSKGKLMTTGLWSWSRHPNYFGEVVQWWGIWLSVIELPWGWLTVLSPIGVTFLIMKVSGVSMLEELMKSRPGFEAYAKRTSEFFPRPPRNQN